MKIKPKNRSSTTDGHGWTWMRAVAKNRQFTRQVQETQVSKSVFIRVHPWLDYFFVRFQLRILG
jgi:pyridoxine 5'-phosphate synthase PdxJ